MRARIFRWLCATAALLAPASRAIEAPAPSAPPARQVHASRRQGPIEIDGRLDEPAWAAAGVASTFTQLVPDEGAPATEQTRVRVLWDEDSLYFGAECDDHETPVLLLNRRDRQVESDALTIELDTQLDRRTAYRFTVFAAGQQLDGMFFDDTNFGTDWDATWESAVARTPTGWSVELRIPLRALRIPEGIDQMGLDVVRVLARRHEESHWQFTPRGVPGLVSRLGALSGLAGIRPVRSLELKPYVVASGTLTNAAPAGALAPARLGGCSSVGVRQSTVSSVCLGLDLRTQLSSSLSLVATVNPDFGQVETDQRVMNLTTLETFLPEKRPFFLEGADFFQAPVRMAGWGGLYGGDAFQLFYSRRVGSGLAAPGLADGSALLYQPGARPVATALKLAGRVGFATVAVLSALELPVHAQVLAPDGSIQDPEERAAAHSAALRARLPLGDHALVGLTATARDPLYSPGARHSHVGALDLAAFDAARDWTFAGQLAGSLLTGGDRVVQPDGTVLEDGSRGTAASAKLAKDAGAVTGFVDVDLLSPGFEANDLGYVARSNLFRSFAAVAFKDLHPSERWQKAQITLSGRVIRDASLSTQLYTDVIAQPEITFGNFWSLVGDAVWVPARGDDRELGDGTPFVQRGGWGGVVILSSDPNRALAGSAGSSYTRYGPGWNAETFLNFTLRPAARLEGQLELDYTQVHGEVRRIRGATTLPSPDGAPAALDPLRAQDRTRLYLFAPQSAQALSATLRTTVAFSPQLSLQAYAQLFLQGVHYDAPLRAVVGPGRGEVRADALLPALAGDVAPAPDSRTAGLDVNLVLRWEWRLGSTIYVVYGHHSEGVRLPGHEALSVGGEAALLGADAARGHRLLVKVDLLSAL